ncbi:MAG: hypothetical protein ACT4O1_09795 [Gemmatimonadota bacterium]
MADEKRQLPPEDIPDDWKRPGGPADYSEGGGTGLEPQPDDEVIGGGVSGSDEDPIGEPGIPDEASFDPETWRSK